MASLGSVLSLFSCFASSQRVNHRPRCGYGHRSKLSGFRPGSHYRRPRDQAGPDMTTRERCSRICGTAPNRSSRTAGELDPSYIAAGTGPKSGREELVGSTSPCTDHRRMRAHRTALSRRPRPAAARASRGRARSSVATCRKPRWHSLSARTTPTTHAGACGFREARRPAGRAHRRRSGPPVRTSPGSASRGTDRRRACWKPASTHCLTRGVQLDFWEGSGPRPCRSPRRRRRLRSGGCRTWWREDVHRVGQVHEQQSADDGVEGLVVDEVRASPCGRRHCGRPSSVRRCSAAASLRGIPFDADDGAVGSDHLGNLKRDIAQASCRGRGRACRAECRHAAGAALLVRRSWQPDAASRMISASSLPRT